ncbi:MAG: aquaporin [Chitinophagaceae bacterium]|nr:aquaporin [Chitinophagaceae bacterium]
MVFAYFYYQSRCKNRVHWMHYGCFVGAFGIGLSLGAKLVAINPARDLGPRFIHFILPIKGKAGSDWGYSWIPVAGPVTGGLIAAWVYHLVQ